MKWSLCLSSKLNQWPSFGNLHGWLGSRDYLPGNCCVDFEIWTDEKCLSSELKRSTGEVYTDKLHLNSHPHSDHIIYGPNANTSGYSKVTPIMQGSQAGTSIE